MDDSKIVCTFSDTGTGISKEHQKILFTPFYTTKKRGTGLGLTIVFRILKGNKGEIQFTTEKNEGTCFIIRLPIGEVL